MKFTNFLVAISAAVLLTLASAGTATAGPMTCPGTAAVTDREATFDSALSCGWGDGNAGLAEVEAFTGTTGWTNAGELEENAGNGVYTDDLLTIDITSGAWGDKNVGGDWMLPEDFWDSHSRAIITFHVGNGNDDTPDHWLFEIDPGTDLNPFTQGTWSIDGSCCNGGGLSNFKLWVQNGVSVPEPMTIGLLGGGLLGLALMRRRRRI